MDDASPFARERKKRKNAVLGLYDLPIYRDGAAWSGAIWFVFSVVIYSTSDVDDATPRWVVVLAGTAIMVFLFSILPALIRRSVRKWRAGRRSADTTPEQWAGAGAPPPSDIGRGPVAGAGPDPSAGPPVAPPRFAPPTAPPPGPPTVSAAPTASFAAPSAPAPLHVPGAPGASSAPPPPGVPAAPSIAPEVDANRVALLADARRRMPHPVARAVRSIEVASNPREEYDAVLRASETLTIVLGVMAVGAYRDVGTEPPEFDQLRQAYLNQGVSQGHWLAALKAVEKIIPQRGERLPGLGEALRRGKKGSGLFADLDALVQERNRWAHGAAPRNGSDAKARMDELRPVFVDALRRATFVKDVPWILTRSTSYRRDTNDFRVSALDATGDHPDFERRQFSSRVPLADDTFYMLTPDGPCELSPFVVMHDCPECRQEEICYSDRLDSRFGVSLKSFARGHAMYEPDLNAELERLFAVQA